MDISQEQEFVGGGNRRSTIQRPRAPAHNEFSITGQDAGSQAMIQTFGGNNKRFAEKAFRAAVDDANQSISYCGMGARRQNGIA